MPELETPATEEPQPANESTPAVADPLPSSDLATVSDPITTPAQQSVPEPAPEATSDLDALD